MCGGRGSGALLSGDLRQMERRLMYRSFLVFFLIISVTPSANNNAQIFVLMVTAVGLMIDSLHKRLTVQNERETILTSY